MQRISTRTPHAGSDDEFLRKAEPVLQISTRTPHAGSDFDFLVAYRLGHISTRTPHAGSDHTPLFHVRDRSYFNPHSPCGE